MGLGLATEFLSEKIPRNRLGTASVIPRSKGSFGGIPRFTEESIPKLGKEGNGMKKLVLQKILLQQTELTACLSSETCFGTEFRVVVSSEEWFRTEFQVFAYVFVPRNEIPSCFLFSQMVQNGIPSVASNFVPWYRIPSIFLLCGTVWNGIPRIFCSAEQPEFRRNKPIVLSIPSSAE